MSCSGQRSTPEHFLLQPENKAIADDLRQKWSCGLAGGALRLLTRDTAGQLQSPSRARSPESQVRCVIESGLYPITRLDPEAIAAEIEDLLIDTGAIPEWYFRPDERDEASRLAAAERLRADQREQLMTWADYLRTGEPEEYPQWFRVYAWVSVKRMGRFDHTRHQYKSRGTNSMAPYPELDRRAVVAVYQRVSEGLTGDECADLGFSRRYAMMSFPRQSASLRELYQHTEGHWVTYPQIDGEYQSSQQMHQGTGQYDDTKVDDPVAKCLSHSLRGKWTGWCVVGEKTAAHYLSKGDVMVYYSRDQRGDFTVPRLIICRDEEGGVTEARGIAMNQNIQPNMTEVLASKLDELEAGQVYTDMIRNLRRLNALAQKTAAGAELNIPDLSFLYSTDAVFLFGHHADPRRENLMDGRSPSVDLRRIIEHYGSEAGKHVDIWHFDESAILENFRLLRDNGVQINQREIENLLRYNASKDDITRNRSQLVACGVSESLIDDILVNRMY